MLAFFRKHQRLIHWVLLILVAPAFLLFGVQDYGNLTTSTDKIAKVGDVMVTRPEIDRVYRAELLRMQKLLPGFDVSRMIDATVFREKILSDLILRKVLLNEARRQRIFVSDEVLRERIRSIPDFISDGKFDFQTYQAVLSSNGLTAAEFEKNIRRDTKIDVIQEAVLGTAFVPNEVVDRVAMLEGETRDIRSISFRPADFLSAVSLTEKRLSDFYKKNIQRFYEPESAKIEYIFFSEKMAREGGVVSEEEILSRYEKFRREKMREQKRRASHILIDVPHDASEEVKRGAFEKATEILEKIKAGADFSEMAKKFSKDTGSAKKGGDLGFFSREGVPEALASVLFSMNPGEVSEVVKTRYGYHIARLMEIQGEAAPSLVSVREALIEEITAQKAKKRFLEMREDLQKSLEENPGSLMPIAQKAGLAVLTAEGVRRDGEGAPPLLKQPKLLDALFSPESQETQEIMGFFDVEGGVVAARLLEHSAAKPKPFHAVRSQVEQQLKMVEARRLASAAGRAKFAQLQRIVPNESSSSGSSGLQRAGAEMVDLKGFSPQVRVGREPSATLSRKAVDAVFGVNQKQLPKLVVVDEDEQYTIYRVEKAHLLAPEPALRNRVRERLAEEYGSQSLLHYTDELKKRTKIVRYSSP